MGSNPDKSELYLKLLKLIFTSIPYFPQENEQLLKPYIFPVISKSLTHCKSATDPMGYFYLIKALYRGLGSASEATYNEFRFQLTDLLSTLNKFHSTAQTQHLHCRIVNNSFQTHLYVVGRTAVQSGHEGTHQIYNIGGVG